MSNVALDIHFWVSKDGKIIDNSINFMKTFIAMMGGGQLVYLPYPKDVSDRIIAEELSDCRKSLAKKGKTLEQSIQEGKDGKNDSPFNCVGSAVCYAHHNGGEVQVGCFGYVSNTDGKVHWLFSHPDNSYTEWKVAKYSKIKNERYTNVSEHSLILTEIIERDIDIPEIKVANIKMKPNEKCICKSGLKFKKCCGAIAKATA
jgi:hypothetical protein